MRPFIDFFVELEGELGFLDMDRDLIVRIIDSISFSTEDKPYF